MWATSCPCARSGAASSRTCSIWTPTWWSCTIRCRSTRSSTTFSTRSRPTPRVTPRSTTNSPATARANSSRSISCSTATRWTRCRSSRTATRPTPARESCAKSSRTTFPASSLKFLFRRPSAGGAVGGGLWFTVYSALVSGFASSALASGFAAGAAGAAGFTTGFGGYGSSFRGKRMIFFGHFWAHIPQPLHLS